MVWVPDKALKIRTRSVSGAALGLFNHNWADGFGLIEHLTMQAVDAFVRVNLAGWMNRLYWALVRAGLAWAAAFLVALQPVKHPQPRRNSEGGAKWAQVTAKEPLNKKTGNQQGRNIGYKGPCAHKV